MTDIDRLLADAGARWRAGQPAGPALAVAELLDRSGGAIRQGSSALVGLVAAAVVVALLGVLAFGRLGSSGPGGPTVGLPAASHVEPSAPVAADRPSPMPGTTSSAPACDITTPDPVFVPPKPFLRVPPANYQSEWYGSARLFTMINRVPKPLGPWVAANGPFPDKTFWWSADWVASDELEPDITVTGRRLDGLGTFTYGHPGTNASADFGTAMLVGVDYPSVGCWEITARYRDGRLSYVVQVVD